MTDPKPWHPGPRALPLTDEDLGLAWEESGDGPAVDLLEWDRVAATVQALAAAQEAARAMSIILASLRPAM